MDLNFVLQAPSVSRLAMTVYNAIHPSSSNAQSNMQQEQDVQKLIDKYTSSFPLRPQELKTRNTSGDIILLTGTTGGLGCNILAHLSMDPSVKKIFAFNRPSHTPILRQIHTMERQGLLDECMRSPKFQLIEGDLSKPALGLNPETFNEVIFHTF